MCYFFLPLAAKIIQKAKAIFARLRVRKGACDRLVCDYGFSCARDDSASTCCLFFFFLFHATKPWDLMRGAAFDRKEEGEKERKKKPQQNQI